LAFALECASQPHSVTSPLWENQPYSDLRNGVRTRLTEFYRKLLADDRATKDFKDKIMARILVQEWWLDGSFEREEAEQVLTEDILGFIRVAQREPAAIEIDDKMNDAWRYLYQAWRKPDERESYALRAIVRAQRSRPNQQLVQVLSAWLEQPSWIGLVTKQPPPELRIDARRQRSGFNLLARNMDGLKPIDIAVSTDSYLTITFFRFLFGNKWDIPAPAILQQLSAIEAAVRGAKPIAL
jgi:hypothetical protein